MDQLVAFLETVETGSFSAAAKSLSTNKTRVSQLVEELEIELNLKLFDRAPHQPKLTDEGAEVLKRARIMIHQHNRLIGLSSSLADSGVTELRIGLGRLMPMSYVDEALVKLANRFPDLQVKVERGSHEVLRHKIEQGELDVFVQIMGGGTLAEFVDLYECRPLAWKYVCSPDSDLLTLNEIDMDALSSYRQIVCDALSELPLTELLGTASTQVWSVSEQLDVIQMVEQDLGFALVPASMVDERVAIGALSVFEPVFRPIAQPILTPVECFLRPSVKADSVQSYLLQQLLHIQG
ncbi:LysR family transcriptional regulator [Paraferrimonas sedimenticola]|nr:LysR family transcriptional regulator [Paraferrimonas sedimenticola]